MSNNPFEELDLDPCLDLETLTELLQERAEELPPEERGLIQGLWRSLTLHPKERLIYALLARPRSQGGGRSAKALARTIPRPAPDPEVTADTLLDQVRPLDLLLLPRYTAEPFPKVDWPQTRLAHDPFFDE